MKHPMSVEKIRELILPVLEQQEIDLVDIELKGKTGNQVLQIFIDTVDGIKLSQCTQISREVADIIDMKDLITEKYRLEVSSPGLDRPLKNYKDFKRNLTRKVKIDFVNESEEKVTKIGIIDKVEENIVVIKEKDQSFEILIKNILSAKIVPSW